MLVLSRKVGEQVVIGENIRVTVVAVRGHQVRLGFVAPDDVAIRREEICFDLPEQDAHVLSRSPHLAAV
jgi:carbon storage regulator